MSTPKWESDNKTSLRGSVDWRRVVKGQAYNYSCFLEFTYMYVCVCEERVSRITQRIRHCVSNDYP
jgi:hypothetical protein